MLIIVVAILLVGFTLSVLIAVHLLVSGINTFTSAFSVPTPISVIPEVIQALDLPIRGTYLEPGCGHARVLKSVLMAAPKLDAVGIENDPIALAIARLRLRNKAKLIRGNLLNAKFDGVDRVFLYLSPRLMAALEDRFEKQLPPGARVVSLQFPFINRKPTAEINLDHSLSHARRLYVYDY
jgi:hypothetical protein